VLVRLWDYLDGTLNPDATASLRAHLTECPQCREYHAFQEDIFQAMDSLKVRTPTPRPVRARLIATLIAAGFDPTALPSRNRESTPFAGLAESSLRSR
jgi:anti-sigma factor RsiW